MSENASLAHKSMSGDEMTENEVSDNESRSDDEVTPDSGMVSEPESEFNPEYCSGCGGSGGLLTSSSLDMIEEAAERGCPTCLFLQPIVEN